MFTSCANNKRKSDLELSNEHDKKTANEPKKYLITELVKTGYLAKFQKEICGGKSLASTECGIKFNEMYYTRLLSKFNTVTPNEIITHCKAYPIKCKRLKYQEEYIEELHNKKQNESDYEEQVARNHAEMKAIQKKRSTFATALYKMGSVKRRVNKKSNYSNSKTYDTDCESQGSRTSCTTKEKTTLDTSIYNR